MMATFTKPWSAKHKQVTKHGSLPYNLSNSFAEPLTSQELIDYARQRGDQALVDAYQSHPLDYTPNGGSADLREEIANLYDDTITADHILVFPGAQVALQTAAFAMAGNSNGKCHSIVFTPGYQSLQEAPIHAGSEVTRIELEAENGWQIDPQKVRAALQKHTKYLVLNEPYNPAGTLMSREIQQEVIAMAQEHHLVILCDEVYRWLEHDPNDRLPAMCEVYDQGLSCVTMSKPWGACGVTIGWIACRDPALKQRLVDVQYFGTACPSRASELQGLMVLRASDVILEKNLAIIRHNLTHLDTFMETYRDFFSWIRPKAGAIAAIRCLGPWTSEELGAHLAAAGIGIKPAYCFSGDRVTDKVDYFRVGYGETTLPVALGKLTEFVEAHKEQWRAQSRSNGSGLS